MKIEKMKEIYLEDYDVRVKPYLSYAQIQGIVKAISHFDTWAERQQNIDMCVLLFVTDIPQEKLEEVGHEKLYESGLIDAVITNVKNYDKINEAITYTFSLTHLVNELSRAYPDYTKQLTDLIQKAKNPEKKSKTSAKK